MSTTIRFSAVAAICFSLLAAPGSAAEWRAGVARVVITPSRPVWLSGYSSRDRLPDGKVHDLFAKAAAFESLDGTRLVIVTCDLGSMDPAITAAVSSEVDKRYGLSRESLVLNVSHTHCAPEIAAERNVFHALAPEEDAKLSRYVAEELQPKLIQLIGKALDDLQPATLTVSHASAEFAKNRRFPTPDGFVNQPYADGVTDHDVPVMRILADDGRLRGVLFGYACHNTTLAFYKFCGDYAGFAQAEVEAAHPGAVAMFVMGCGGDQNPYPRHGERGLEYCRQHGKELADAVGRALSGDQVEVHAPLRIASEVVSLELQPLPPRKRLEEQAASATGHRKRKARYLLEQIDEVGPIKLEQRCPLQAAQFGNELLFLFFSGETVVDYSRRSKAEFAGPTVWVAGYCNDVFAYLPSLRVLQEGGYEGLTGIVHQLTPTPFAVSVEDRVMGGMRRLVRRVSQKD